MTKPFPARLHILLASQAPTGLVIRRGPANAVCTIGWNRKTDEFEVGQWLRGRIYERRADLSPNGQHLIYFARGSRGDAETKGSWTAISRSPWLHAITLYGKGDCWQGGGLFTSNKTYWLNGCHFVLRQDRRLGEDQSFVPQGSFGAECPSVYYRRLIRDGWSIELQDISRKGVAPCNVFTKPLPDGWMLRKFAHADANHPPGTGCYWDDHELENPKKKIRLSLPDWEWADLDGKTVAWAEKGILYRAQLNGARLGPPKLLFDFNPLRFEARQAPY